jgi:hypothetical protein
MVILQKLCYYIQGDLWVGWSRENAAYIVYDVFSKVWPLWGRWCSEYMSERCWRYWLSENWIFLIFVLRWPPVFLF